MPDPGNDTTQILTTTVEADGDDAALVEIEIADAATIEEATEMVVLSVRVKIGRPTLPFAYYQQQALHRAVELIRQHSQPLDKLLD